MPIESFSDILLTTINVIIKQIKPAVVAVSGVEKGGPKGFIFDIVGSGFNIHPDGLVVTNHHVIKAFIDVFMQREMIPERGVDELRGKALNILFYKLTDDPTLKRTIKLFTKYPFNTYYDEKEDFAWSTLNHSGDQLPYLELEDSNNVQEGDDVFVCGFPYGSNLHDAIKGIHMSISKGIVSSIIPFAGVPTDYMQAFQLDILLNPGNSGGPVIHAASGSVIGIATSIYLPEQNGIRMPSGISFAVPINFVKNHIYSKLNISNKDFRIFQKTKIPEQP